MACRNLSPVYFEELTFPWTDSFRVDLPGPAVVVLVVVGCDGASSPIDVRTYVELRGLGYSPSKVARSYASFRVLGVASHLIVTTPTTVPLTVAVHGHSLAVAPSVPSVIPLLNASARLREASRFREAVHTDVLAALALVDGRSYQQSSELLLNAATFVDNLDDTGSSDDVVLSSLAASSAGLRVLAAAALTGPNKTTDKLKALSMAVHSDRLVEKHEDALSVVSRLQPDLILVCVS